MSTLTEPIGQAFNEVMASFNTGRAITFLKSGKFSSLHYKSVLREIYHYTKEDPQMQSLATVYFRGDDRAMIKAFLRHALSEVGHDQLALQDLRVLGETPSDIRTENPLPSTVAFTAYGFYTITHQNPISYIGYLYFLEHMPTEHGQVFSDALLGAGIPESAMTFLIEHQKADVGHNALMRRYLENLVHDKYDVDAVIYAIRTAGHLYADMLWGAIVRAEHTVGYGTNWVEDARIIKR